MPLTKLNFKPGVNRETTSYSNEGGWFDSEKVRFRAGYPEKIGGWLRYSESAFLGDCRGLHPFVALDGTKYIGVGTHLKYYLNQGGSFNDITPIRLTTSAGDATFSATNGSSTLTVTENGHGAVVGDFVTFSGAATLGGLITADVLNQEYQIASIVDTNSYTIEAREVATISSITTTSGLNPTAVSANSSDTGNGGGSVVATYQTSTGLEVSIQGTGWGAGVYGRGTWNSNADVSLSTTSMRIWTHDNFGEDLIINVRDGIIGYYDTSAGLNSRAVLLKDVSGANTTPTIAKQVIVSDRDRHVIAFGCDPQTNIGTQDPLLIRFSSQESITDWESTATNTAGDLRIGSGSQIITAVETRREIIVFTDVSLHSMQFIGPPFTFGITAISENITIAGPLSPVAVEDAVFWMGVNEFYVYKGGVQRIPCSVKDFVFSDINREQLEKVTAGVNSSFAEIWWFYPSADSTENNKYVIYNYEQKIWYFGSLARTFWMDRGIYEFPIAAGTDHYLFNHENGFDDGSTVPASAISSHIESSQIDIGDGDRFLLLNKLVPDITFRNSPDSNPNAIFTLKTRNFPGGDYLQTNDSTISRTAQETTTVVEQYTNQANIRLRGRSFALRVSSTATETGWRLGSPRLEIRPDGRR
tara:strand:- start:1296 stop:3221 length:1926 start_codon:yes stop_codon:yes gene_type:complete